MTDDKSPPDPPASRPARRVPPSLAAIQAGNPDDIFAPPGDAAPPSSAARVAPPAARPGTGGIDDAATDAAISIPTGGPGPGGTPGAAPRAATDVPTVLVSSPPPRSFTAGDRLEVPSDKPKDPAAKRKSMFGIVGGGAAAAVLVIGGITWWTLNGPADTTRTADVSSSRPPAAGAPTPATPPVRGDTTVPAPADTAKAPPGKPDPVASADTPPAAPPPPPPLPPRTGAITDEPLDLLKRRAAAGETDSMEELARRYIEGVGVPSDTAEGVRWLEEAAARGAPGAMFNLGVMYERGIAVPKDLAKALDWYARASAGGVAMATHNMALMYREGVGVPADHKRAAELLLAAARNGMSASMFALATMYEAGSHGTRKDLVQAVMWYAMAMHFQQAHPATENSEMAQKAGLRIEALQRVLPAADLKRAQALGEKEYTLIVDTIRAGAKLPPSSPTAAPAGATPSTPAGPSSKSEPAVNPLAVPANPTTQTLPGPKPGATAPAAAQPPAPKQTATRPDARTPAAAPETGQPPGAAAGKPPEAPQVASRPDAKAPATPATKPMSRKDQITEIQKMLAGLRLYDGKADGVLGTATRNAIKQFQRMMALQETGEPSQQLVEELREASRLPERK